MRKHYLIYLLVILAVLLISSCKAQVESIPEPSVPSTTTEMVEPTENNESNNYTVEVTNATELYVCASIDCEITEVLAPGTTVIILATEGEWYQVETRSHLVGFIEVHRVGGDPSTPQQQTAVEIVSPTSTILETTANQTLASPTQNLNQPSQFPTSTSAATLTPLPTDFEYLSSPPAPPPNPPQMGETPEVTLPQQQSSDSPSLDTQPQSVAPANPSPPPGQSAPPTIEPNITEEEQRPSGSTPPPGQ